MSKYKEVTTGMMTLAWNASALGNLNQGDGELEVGLSWFQTNEGVELLVPDLPTVANTKS